MLRVVSRYEDFFRTQTRVKEGIVATTTQNDIPSIFSLVAVPSNGA
jgi:hypothetical protein